LIASPVDNCFTFDAGVEDDDFEAVKICMRGGNLVEFRKQISGNFDSIGEWPGFLKLSPEIANALADRLDDYVASGKSDQPYEEAVRDILLEYPENTFGIADVTGIPWIEIDFPEDAIRAEQEILPAIKAFR